MEERRLWSADHEPDRRPRAADPDRWPARADAPGDGGVRRRGARRLPGPGPPAAAGRAGAAPAAPGLPVLGLVAESEGPAPEEVRRALGIRTYLYHLVVEPGSQLTPHHATHAGTGLASAHAAAVRDLEAIRAHAPGRQELVDELAGATTAGLVRAQALLARAIAPDDQRVAAAAAATDLQPDALRAALLQALRGGGTTTTESR